MYTEEAETQIKEGEHEVEEPELFQEPSETEVKESIKRLKNGKAAGPVELLKRC